MFPFKNTIQLDRTSQRNLYLQLCDQIIGTIKLGKLPPSTKLPGSRKLAEELNIHRKTVLAAYDELLVQGWIETFPAKGTYITSTLPIVTPRHLDEEIVSQPLKTKSNFSFIHRPHFIDTSSIVQKTSMFKINDGAPDHRLAPIDEISKTYRNIVKKNHYKNLLSYTSEYGNTDLRKALVPYLNQTRGLHITMDNILITRGSQMGIYLTSHIVLSSQKTIIVGDTNYTTADSTFIDAGANIERVNVDKNGIDTDQIACICSTKKISAVYVTSHHHHPTTVTLSAKRRMHLLQLAQKHKFAIIEDDYDYDFHYENAPILPLASNDYNGNVLYIGGFTKIIAPSLRIGYLIGPKDLIDEAARLRKVIDRQGDNLLEQTLASMIKAGDVQRHSNKVLKIYKTRRDLFCNLLSEKLSMYLDFEIPNGGMAVWVRLNKEYNWNDVVTRSLELNLELNPDWQRYDSINSGHNGIRLGFASLNEIEITEVIDRLSKVLKSISI